MAYEKTYRTLGPFPLDVDVDLMLWLAREAAEKKLAAEGLEVVSFTDREVPVDEIPPKALKQLGRPLEDFRWFEFTIVGQVNKPVLDWLTAECVWNNQQWRDWLAAEKLHNKKADWAVKREAQRAQSV